MSSIFNSFCVYSLKKETFTATASGTWNVSLELFSFSLVLIGSLTIVLSLNMESVSHEVRIWPILRLLIVALFIRKHLLPVPVNPAHDMLHTAPMTTLETEVDKSFRRQVANGAVD